MLLGKMHCIISKVMSFGCLIPKTRQQVLMKLDVKFYSLPTYQGNLISVHI